MSRDMDTIKDFEARAMEAEGENRFYQQLMGVGIFCEFVDKSIPVIVENDSDPTVGLSGPSYLSLMGDYEVVPSSFLRGLKRTIGDGLYEKSVDLWQQLNDPNYGKTEVAKP